MGFDVRPTKQRLPRNNDSSYLIIPSIPISQTISAKTLCSNQCQTFILKLKTRIANGLLHWRMKGQLEITGCCVQVKSDINQISWNCQMHIITTPFRKALVDSYGTGGTKAKKQHFDGVGMLRFCVLFRQRHF